MIRPDQIPDEVAEALALQLGKVGVKLPSQGSGKKAIAAALNAWPEAWTIRVTMPIGCWVDDLPAFILPLSKEVE